MDRRRSKDGCGLKEKLGRRRMKRRIRGMKRQKESGR
jgi:hypothetical protein